MSIYDYSVTSSNGTIIPLSQFMGQVLLIVNTATKCGLAPQFEGLELLHQKYKDKQFTIIGFPCNQFMHQEPETNDSMVASCKLNFGVTFQLSKIIDVNGKNTDPVFVYLKEKLPGGWFGNKIKWNFTKFLINKEGIPFKRYAPTVQPSAIEKDIMYLLTK